MPKPCQRPVELELLKQVSLKLPCEVTMFSWAENHWVSRTQGPNLSFLLCQLYNNSFHSAILPLSHTLPNLKGLKAKTSTGLYLKFYSREAIIYLNMK